MSIRRGTASNSRHARNYTGQQADARLQEVIRPMQEQQRNALNTDWLEVWYYQNVPSSTVCTCRQVDAEDSDLAEKVGPTLKVLDSDVEVDVDWKRPLFGKSGDSSANNVEDLDAEELDNDVFVDETGQHSTHLFGQSVNCGICYRTGFVPGFQRIGAQRQMLTTHHVEDMLGYTVYRNVAPSQFKKLDSKGFVEFDLDVPRYFNSASFSIRLNHEVLDDAMLYCHNGQRLTMSDLRNAAGRSIKVKVMVMEFTHAVVDFDLGVAPTHANFAQLNKTLDWTMLDTLGNLNVVLPNSLDRVSNGDLIYVPTRKQTFKVTDVTYLETARDFKLDWTVNTRVLQPQEGQKYIYRASAIL